MKRKEKNKKNGLRGVADRNDRLQIFGQFWLALAAVAAGTNHFFGAACLGLV